MSSSPHLQPMEWVPLMSPYSTGLAQYGWLKAISASIQTNALFFGIFLTLRAQLAKAFIEFTVIHRLQQCWRPVAAKLIHYDARSLCLLLKYGIRSIWILTIVLLTFFFDGDSDNIGGVWITLSGAFAVQIFEVSYSLCTFPSFVWKETNMPSSSSTNSPRRCLWLGSWWCLALFLCWGILCSNAEK